MSSLLHPMYNFCANWYKMRIKQKNINRNLLNLGYWRKHFSANPSPLIFQYLYLIMWKPLNLLHCIKLKGTSNYLKFIWWLWRNILKQLMWPQYQMLHFLKLIYLNSVKCVYLSYIRSCIFEYSTFRHIAIDVFFWKCY